MRPTTQRTRRMKEPMMTIPGSSWRCEMSQSMMIMKKRESAETEIQ